MSSKNTFKRKKARREKALERLKELILKQNHVPKRFRDKEDPKDGIQKYYKEELKAQIAKLEERVKQQ